MHARHLARITMVSALTLACAGATPGAQPHDMSARQHDQSAVREEREAERHQAKYEPDAPGDAVRNPTAQHAGEAARARKAAADHRAASKALRDAEARACVGIPDDDRDMSPFAHRENIARVEPLESQSRVKPQGAIRKTIGATVYLRSVPGITAESLQHVVDCHLARNAALGHRVPEMDYCPLVPKGVSAKVSLRARAFVVDISAADPNTAGEILRRAQALGGAETP